MANQKQEKINVHMFWAYGQLGQIEQLSLNSFIANNFNVILWSYGKINNAHPKTILQDAREVILKKTYDLYEKNHLVSFSDFFRYSIFQNHSGLYADTDVIALKNASELPSYPFLVSQRSFKKSFYTHLKKQVILNYFIKKNFLKETLGYQSDFTFHGLSDHPDSSMLLFWAKIKHSILQINNNVFFNPNPKRGDVIDLARVFAENFSLDFLFRGDLGPSYLTALISNYPKISFKIMAPEFANPIDYFCCEKALSDYQINQDSFFIHLWGSKTNTLLSKSNAPFPKGSLLDSLAKKYL